MAASRHPLATISTQYARNGPLLEEAREYVRLVARGLNRAERRETLVIENGLHRHTYKARRNIFEALEARFSDARRARNLGVLTLEAAPSRAFSLGALVELARHDALMNKFLEFLVRHIGSPWRSIDARYFLEELERQTGAVRGWAPTLQRRAVSALNSVPRVFELWGARVGPDIPEVELPVELFATIVHERISDTKSAWNAPEFRMLGLKHRAVVDLSWACARRKWFTVDVVGDIVTLEPSFGDLATMLAAAEGEGVFA